MPFPHRRAGLGRTDDVAALGEALLRGTQLDGEQDPIAITYDEVESGTAYRVYRARMVLVEERRRQLELAMAMGPLPFTYRGYNALIEQHVDYLVDDVSSFESVNDRPIPNYRERVICPITRLNGRMRATLMVLQDHLGHDLSGRVYLTERVTPFFELVRQRNPRVAGSEFLGAAVALGASRDGIRNEDVTRLTFADQSFDLVVCCEVLEHVPRFEHAYAELHRILAPGGLLILTLPFLSGREDHVRRARVDAAGATVHLLPPEYHGDPLNATEGVLCYQNFGWRLLDELRAVGFRQAAAVFYWSLYHGLLGRNQTVFYARK